MPHNTTELRYFSRAEVEELRENLTMLDVFRARKTSQDRAEVGIQAYYEAAKRTGLVGPEAELEAFLVRVLTSDFNDVMQGGRAGVPNSPEPGNSGESNPASSATTDSDLETSSS